MKIKTDTIIRTICLALALINQILQSTGHSVIPISDTQISEFITLALTIGASIVCWWKNNSFSLRARMADAYMGGLEK